MLMLPSLRAWLSIKVKRGEEDEQADWYIDIKDPMLGQVLGNDPANSRPGGHTQRDDHRVQAQC